MATTNKGSAMTFTTPSDHEVVITRVVDALRGRVFDAWTKPEHLPHWMLGPEGWTMPICEVDLRPGGGWHFVWRRSDGTEMEMRGVYREITPSERLVSTESWGGNWPETVNTLILSEKDGKTMITQTVLYPSKEARDAAVQTGMKEGMSQSFDRLDEYLRTQLRAEGRAQVIAAALDENDDEVTAVILKKYVAVELLNALIIQLGIVPPPGKGEGEGGGDYVEVQIFYATDRARGRGATPADFYSGDRGSKTLELGRVSVSIPHDHKTAVLESPSLWKLEFRADPEKHVVLLNVEPLSSDAFVTQAKTRLSQIPSNEVLVFIHGYNVTFEDATRRMAQLTYDLQFQGLPVLYSWPSEGSGAKYTVDEGNARWTEPHFKAFLERVLTEFGADTVHLIAHSMGCRVLAETMGVFDAKSLPAGASPLREIVFAAPDFDAQTFAELAETFHGRKERFTLYSASSDLPLGLSKIVHKYGRAGRSTVVVETVDTIDASNVNTSFIGHSYFGDERTLIGDLVNLIRNNLPPEKRAGLERVPYEKHHYWRFRA